MYKINIYVNRTASTHIYILYVNCTPCSYLNIYVNRTPCTYINIYVNRTPCTYIREGQAVDHLNHQNPSDR